MASPPGLYINIIHTAWGRGGIFLSGVDFIK